MLRKPPVLSMLFFSGVLRCIASWQAGVAKIDITPTESVRLAGYGGATRMSKGVLHPIYLKALAVRDDRDDVSVPGRADLVGLSKKMVESITTRATKELGIKRERLILNYSHNHSCPVTADVLFL